MRKITAVSLVLTIILCALVPASVTLAETGVDMVRVRLTTNNATSIVMNVTGEYFINENGRSFKGGSLTLRAANGAITLTHSTEGELYTGASFTIKRVSMAPSYGGMYFNSRTYLGHFNVRLLSSGYIQVVNEVPLAHYLYGVVAYEMNNNYPLEALKAQAIAAKCYVINSINASPNAEYHIGDTSSDQVYKGYYGSAKNVIEAVDSTLDKVLTVNGKLFCTYYSASNGGETNLVTYAWPSKSVSNAGYAISTDDYDLKNSYSLRETVRIPINSTGTISQGLYDLLVAKAYAALGVMPTGIAAITAVSMDTPQFNGTARNLTRVTVTYDITADIGTYRDLVVTFSASELYTYKAVSNANLRIYWGELASDGSCYYIYHVRWGHGVGLSQRGAQQRASAGQSYQEILAFYYPGAQLASINVAAPVDPIKPSYVASLTPIGTGKTTASVNLRSGAGTTYTSLGKLASGTAFTVYEQKDGWYHILVDGTVYEGWVYAQYASFTTSVTPTPSGSASTDTSASPGASQDPAVSLYGVCTGEGVNYRKGPGVEYDRIKKIAKNTQLGIISQSGSWYYAVCGGDYGYISASYVKLTAAPTPSATPAATPSVTPSAQTSPSASPTADAPGTTYATGVITTDGVNMRKGPDSSYDLLSKLSKNTGVTILSQEGNWYKVLVGTVTGYVYKDYVKFTGSTTVGAAEQTPAASDHGEGKTTGSVNMRKGAGVGNERIKTLAKNTQLSLYELKDGWYRAKTADGTEGWVSSKYVSVTTAIPQTQQPDTSESGNGSAAIGKGVTTASVNFRYAADTSSKIIKLLTKGTEITLYSLSNGWYEAEYGGTRGWLYAKYVKVTATTPTETQDGTTGVVPEGSGVTADKGLTFSSGQTTAKVNFRTKASTASGSAVISTLPAGTQFNILGECGDFYYILFNGSTGFIYKAYAKVTSSGSAGIIAVGDTLTLIATSTTAEVNLRSGAGVEYPKIKTLSSGAAVKVYLVINGWCLVETEGVFGYIIDDYVKLS